MNPPPFIKLVKARPIECDENADHALARFSVVTNTFRGRLCDDCTLRILRGMQHGVAATIVRLPSHPPANQGESQHG